MTILRWLLAWLILAGVASAKPNILLIVSEDNGPELGCYGDPYARTPNLDRLSETGARFERAFVPADNVDDVKNRSDEDGRLIPDGVADPAKAKYSEHLFREAARRFISDNKSRPLFLYYATQLPHGPLIVPDLGPYKDKPWDSKHKEWAAMVVAMDQSVGMIVEQLKQQGLFKNTIFFFAGDNGYSQWGYFHRPAWQDDPLFKNKGPWRAGKFISQEGGVRVPFFVHWPKRVPARESDHICALYDVLPTLADLAGVKVNHEIDGISFVPELQNTPSVQESHRYLYWEGGTRSRHAQAVRLGPWKGYREHPAKEAELYRIESDVACENNIAKEHPGIVKEIVAIFEEAHEDSHYYINPGESDEEVALKTKNAPPMGVTISFELALGGGARLRISSVVIVESVYCCGKEGAYSNSTVTPSGRTRPRYSPLPPSLKFVCNSPSGPLGSFSDALTTT